MSLGALSTDKLDRLQMLQTPGEYISLSRGDIATCLGGSIFKGVRHLRDVLHYPNLLSEFTKAACMNKILQPQGIQREIKKINTASGSAIMHSLESGTGGGALIVNLHGLVAEEAQYRKIHKETHDTWKDKKYDMISFRQHNTSWSGSKEATLEAVAEYIVAGIEHTLTPEHTQIILQGNSAGGIPTPVIVKKILENHPDLRGKIKVIMSAVPMGGEYGNDEGVFNQFLETHLNCVEGIGLDTIRKENTLLAKQAWKAKHGNYKGYQEFIKDTSAEIDDIDIMHMKKNFIYVDELLGLFGQYIFFLLDGDTRNMQDIKSQIGTKYADIGAAFNIVRRVDNRSCEYTKLGFDGWKYLDEHILASSMSETSKAKIKATFINMLFSRKNKEHSVSDDHKNIMIDNGHDLFFQQASAYKWLKDMAHQTSRTDLKTLYQDMVDTIGAENVLVVVGEDDLICPPAAAKAFWHSINPAIQFETIEQCGHVPQMETPEQLVACMDRFIFKVAA